MIFSSETQVIKCNIGLDNKEALMLLDAISNVLSTYELKEEETEFLNSLYDNLYKALESFL